MKREAPTMVLRRKGSSLIPVARFDQHLLEKFQEGAFLRAEIKEQRSLPRARLYWAVLQAVVDATGKWPTSEALHWALKIKLGYIEEIAAVDGKVLIRPRSTSFGKMGEQEFRTYFDAAILVLTTEVLPGLTTEDILALGNSRLGRVA